jgi:hypothetical protein
MELDVNVKARIASPCGDVKGRATSFVTLSGFHSNHKDGA